MQNKWSDFDSALLNHDANKLQFRPFTSNCLFFRSPIRRDCPKKTKNWFACSIRKNLRFLRIEQANSSKFSIWKATFSALVGGPNQMLPFV
jgi:hypothetical protein